MLKTLLALTMACGLFFNANAQDETKSSLFNKEFGFSIASGYTLDTSKLFQNDYSFNLNAGVFYFPFKHFGVEANVPFFQTKGVSVSEVQAGLLARLPLGHVSPYLGAGGVYNWKTEQNWAYVGKVGLELRLNNKWGVFTEAQYRNNNFNWEKGATSLVGGLHFVF